MQDNQINNQPATQNPDSTDTKPQQYVEFSDWLKLDMRVGTIRFVEPVPDTDKLLRCLIEFGPEVATGTYTDEAGQTYPVRQIVSGIKQYYPNYEDLVGTQLLYVINLAPRTIKGIESQGMLMAVGAKDECVFMVPNNKLTNDNQRKIH